MSGLFRLLSVAFGIAVVIALISALPNYRASTPTKHQIEQPVSAVPAEDTKPKPHHKKKETDDDWSPGAGMRYNGKLGLEVAPGVVLDTDGNVGIGFGF